MPTIAFVNAASGVGAASPVSVTLNTTSGNKIVVAICSNQPASGITDTVGTVYAIKTPAVFVVNAFLTFGGVYVSLWTGTAAGTNAANSIVVAFATVNRATVSIVQYSGVAAEGYTSTNLGKSALFPVSTLAMPTGITQTVQDQNNLLVMAYGTNGGNAGTDPSFSASTGTIENQRVTLSPTSKYRVGVIDNTVVTPGPVTCAVTPFSSGFDWGAVALELKTVAPSKQPLGTMRTRMRPTDAFGSNVARL